MRRDRIKAYLTRNVVAREYGAYSRKWQHNYLPVLVIDNTGTILSMYHLVKPAGRQLLSR
jgi:hypothetical protein